MIPDYRSTNHNITVAKFVKKHKFDSTGELYRKMSNWTSSDEKTQSIRSAYIALFILQGECCFEEPARETVPLYVMKNAIEAFHRGEYTSTSIIQLYEYISGKRKQPIDDEPYDNPYSDDEFSLSGLKEGEIFRKKIELLVSNHRLTYAIDLKFDVHATYIIKVTSYGYRYRKYGLKVTNSTGEILALFSLGERVVIREFNIHESNIVKIELWNEDPRYKKDLKVTVKHSP